MKLITRDTDYAIRTLSYVAGNKAKKASVSQIVKELRIPRSFLRKIIQVLNKKGIIKSQKGKGGGFVLMMQPDHILLADLIEIFQGPLSLNECLFKGKICPNIKICVLRKKINSIEKYVINELRCIDISSLLSKKGRKLNE